MLGFSANAMMLDPYALKNLIAHFVEIYNGVQPNKYKYKPTHSRKFSDILKSVKHSFKHRINSLSTKGFNANALVFPAVKSTLNVHALTSAFYMQETYKINQIAKKYNVSINDLILAAYFRTVFSLSKQQQATINIGNYFNPRENATNKNFLSFSNLQVLLPFSLEVKQNESFNETLKKITAIRNIIEKNNLVGEKIHQNPKKNIPQPEYFQFMSLDKNELDAFHMLDNQTQQVYFFAPCRNVPYLCLTSCLCNGQIFLSFMNYCYNEDAQLISYIYQWIKYEVRNFVALSDPKFYTI
ncbi:MAG: hypothetical protein LBS83_01175 [Holosporales bacterium]|jgi:NRPS condensation-like uncharacterized protein|nr:hypothetical protein [Holosporales bacterium]